MVASRELLPATASATLSARIDPRVVSTPETRPPETPMPVTSQFWTISTPRASAALAYPHTAACFNAAAARRVVEIEIGHQRSYLIPIQQFRVNTVKAHGVAAAGKRVSLKVGMMEIENAALTHHDIVIEIALEAFPELHRPFVEGNVSRQQIIRPDDGRVPTCIAGSDPAFLEDGDVGDPVLFRKVVRGSQAVPTATNNDDVVSLSRCGVTPRRPQTLMAGDCIPRQRQNRIAHRSD